MLKKIDWSVIIPVANESETFDELTSHLIRVLDIVGSGKVYFIIDNVSKDNTLELCQDLQKKDNRFEAVWTPQNRNVVDAYINGYKHAYASGHEIIIEMDAGMSHDPRALTMFLRVLNEGNECAFGSRFINGGSIADSNWYRHFLSKTGTRLSNTLLGTRLKDMTSGYQGFHRSVVEKFINYELKSKAHFYQTELRFLLRKTRYMEVPIHYRAPSPSVSKQAIKNSITCLVYYFFHRKLSL